MHLTVERFDARTWPDDVLEELFAGAFPAFITADLEAKRYIGRVREWFADLNIILVNESAMPVATRWGWTGMVFPSTGEYVIPGGLSTLHIDRGNDFGRYVEPNVWVRHR